MRKTPLNLVIAILFCGLLAGCSSTSKPSKPPATRHGWAIFTGLKPSSFSIVHNNSVKRGMEVYKSQCAKCHGPDGKGQDGAADLTTATKNTADHYLVFQISKGKNESMPSWQDVLSPQEIIDVTHYVQSLAKK